MGVDGIQTGSAGPPGPMPDEDALGQEILNDQGHCAGIKGGKNSFWAHSAGLAARGCKAAKIQAFMGKGPFAQIRPPFPGGVEKHARVQDPAGDSPGWRIRVQSPQFGVEI